jgi:predicted MPP superfamily phosphohydrolase
VRLLAPVHPALDLPLDVVERPVCRRVGVLTRALVATRVRHEHLVTGKAHVDREAVADPVTMMVARQLDGDVAGDDPVEQVFELVGAPLKVHREGVRVAHVPEGELKRRLHGEWPLHVRDRPGASNAPAEPGPASYPPAMTWFYGLSIGGWLAAVLAARLARGSTFAIFVGVLVGIYSLIATALVRWVGPALPVFTALHLSVYVNFLALSRPRMRPLLYRLLVSWPSSFFVAGTLLALPWALVAAFGVHPWGLWIPYALAAVGVFQSLTTRREDVDLVIPGVGQTSAVAAFGPHPRGDQRVPRPLRIVQISDPHLGPFMSVARLRRIADRAVEAKPDLVLLTGDFLTMESQSDPELLLDALEPLKALPGKVFACHGNHDHEAPAVVSRALIQNGIELLVDDARTVTTEVGPVQILGLDFSYRDRKARLARACAEHPRVPGALRVVLLHDPGAFRHLPEGEGDLVLSGHTHGGQVGLLSLGLEWTFLRLFGDRIPDHGFWARGTDRMWIHRGTGHYGFPLRLGVPAEESVLRIHHVAG